MIPRLMHCLPSTAGLALSPSRLVMALSAFLFLLPQGVLSRLAGKAKAYDSSDALAKSKMVWNRDSLERWLTDPDKVIPGLRMGYRLSIPSERSCLVVYLTTLSELK